MTQDYSYLLKVRDLKQQLRHVVYKDMGKFAYGIKHSSREYAKRQIKLYSEKESSAISLDEQLQKAGFKTKYRFSYKYNTPGLTSSDIVYDAYRLEYFYNLAILPIKVKLGCKSDFYDILHDAAGVTYKYAAYIWENNPSARFDYDKRFDAWRDWGMVISFLLGVGFQFHPRDINEFIVHHNEYGLTESEYQKRYKQQLVFKNWCANKYNIDTGCLVLCPGHREKLAKILTRTDTPYVIQQLQSMFSFLLSGRQY